VESLVVSQKKKRFAYEASEFVCIVRKAIWVCMWLDGFFRCWGGVRVVLAVFLRVVFVRWAGTLIS